MRKNRDGQVELILENRQVLLIFFVIVALCGVFFSLGYIVGRNTFSPSAAVATAETASAEAGARPSPMPPAAYLSQSPAPTAAGSEPSAAGTDLNFYQSVEEAPEAKLAPPESAGNAASGPSQPVESPEPPALEPPPPGILVQVSALTRREDADSLVRLLKEKNLPVLVTSGVNDALFHVVVGPYKTEQEAQEVKLLLEQDGFRPLVKR